MNVLALAAALALAQVPAPEPAPDAAPDPAAVPSATRRPRAAAREQGSTAAPTPTADDRGRPGPPAQRPTSTPPKRLPEGAPPAQASETVEAERTARSFLEALARGDATALAQAAGERFSFDGDVQAGRETIRRTWRDLLAARPPAAPPAVGALEVLHAPDAQTRFGKPPSRLAPLVRQGVTIAIGDVGGRTVVLFLAREAGRMAVLGMHD